jgi:hypothetical protein
LHRYGDEADGRRGIEADRVECAERSSSLGARQIGVGAGDVPAEAAKGEAD